MPQKLQPYHDICFNPPAHECEAQPDLVAQINEIHDLIRIAQPAQAVDPWRERVFINNGPMKAMVIVCSTFYPMR